MAPQASGFPCPKCQYRDIAYIEGRDLVHILELRCGRCGARWAVENRYPADRGGYMDPGGRVMK